LFRELSAYISPWTRGKESFPMPETSPDLPAAARRALAEAAERRRQADAALPPPKEYGGRDGPDPVRYGDYEKKGLAIDF
jgi:hypothetical protein